MNRPVLSASPHPLQGAREAQLQRRGAWVDACPGQGWGMEAGTPLLTYSGLLAGSPLWASVSALQQERHLLLHPPSQGLVGLPIPPLLPETVSSLDVL